MLENYIVVDLEMTGLDFKRDQILEIGAVKVRQKQVVDTFSCLLRPTCAINETVQKLTGITNEMAANGREPEAAIKDFLDFLEEDIWVGHNCIFDYSFVRQWTVNHKIPFEKKAVDTLKIARKCLLEPEKKTLEDLCEYFHISRENAHRALDDALATQELFEILEARFYDKETEIFMPRLLQCKVKRQTPATPRQKNYLNELAKYHKIELDVSLEHISRSDASRLTDKIIQQYGRLTASAEQASGKLRP